MPPDLSPNLIQNWLMRVKDEGKDQGGTGWRCAPNLPYCLLGGTPCSARVAVERWPCCAWRLLEQSQRQCALRQPEQEPSRQPQPKHGFSGGFGFFSSTPREALGASSSQSRLVHGPDGRAVVRVQTAVRRRSAVRCGLAESQNRPARAGRREPNVLAGTFGSPGFGRTAVGGDVGPIWRAGSTLFCRSALAAVAACVAAGAVAWCPLP